MSVPIWNNQSSVGTIGADGATGPQGPTGPPGSAPAAAPAGAIQYNNGLNGFGGSSRLIWNDEELITTSAIMLNSLSLFNPLATPVPILDNVNSAGLEGQYLSSTSTGVRWETLPVIAGPTGPEGPAGATGPAGIDGTNGAPGSPGDTGATGDIGPAGPQGPAGPAGSPPPVYQATYYKTTAQNLSSPNTDIIFDAVGTWNNDGGYITHTPGTTNFTVVQTGLYQLEFHATVLLNGGTWSTTVNRTVSIDITRPSIPEQVVIGDSCLMGIQNYTQTVTGSFYLVAGDVINLRVGNTFTVIGVTPPQAQSVLNTFDLNTFFAWTYVSA